MGHIVDFKSTAANNGGEEGRSCRGRVAKSLYYDSAYEPNVPMNTYNKIRLVQRCDSMNAKWLMGKIAAMGTGATTKV